MPAKKTYEFGETIYGSWLTFLMETRPHTNPSGRLRRKAFFSCVCGNICEVMIESWKSCYTKSCGCFHRKTVREKFSTHRLSKMRAYTSYKSMIRRCYTKTDIAYKDYGGRGIKVCDRWLDGEKGLRNFIFDMGERPEQYTLERLDVNGDYAPENCIWSDRVIQAYNTRRHKTNTSSRTGVYISHYRKDGKPVYSAYCQYEGETKHLGSSTEYLVAVSLREEAEIKYYGMIKPSEDLE